MHRMMLIILAVSYSSVVLAMEPQGTLPLLPPDNELSPIMFGEMASTSPNGLVLMQADSANPSKVGIELWHELPDGSTVPLTTAPFLPIAGVFAYIPLAFDDKDPNEIIHLSQHGDSTLIGISRLEENCSTETVASITIPSGIARPRGYVIANADDINTSPGPDPVLLVRPDLLIVMEDDGNGNIAPYFTTVELPPPGNWDMVKAGDVTGDGAGDILVGDSSTGEIAILANTAIGGSEDPSFEHIQTITISGLAYFELVAFDPDSPLDIVALASSTTGTYDAVVALNSGEAAPYDPAWTYTINTMETAVISEYTVPFQQSSINTKKSTGTEQYRHLDKIVMDPSGNLLLSFILMEKDATVRRVLTANYEMTTELPVVPSDALIGEYNHQPCHTHNTSGSWKK